MTQEPLGSERAMTVRLSQHQHRALRQRALDENRRASDIIRDAIAHYLDMPDSPCADGGRPTAQADTTDRNGES